MILPIFTLTLEPSNPLHFSIDELRSFFHKKTAEFTRLHKDSTSGFIHRYPVVQCKQIKSILLVIGVGQGADLLQEISVGAKELRFGETICSISGRDQEIQKKEFGISDEIHTYEFLTPWLALNQQNAKKFYDLKGKPDRDAFMQKILSGHLSTLAKSIDYDLPAPLTCKSRVRFKRERIHQENVMVFLGTFGTNLTIPDFLGIGQSVSSGFGTIRCTVQAPDHHH
jgi:Cas6b C-terminal domain/Cas6b N-terminal domain